MRYKFTCKNKECRDIRNTFDQFLLHSLACPSTTKYILNIKLYKLESVHSEIK